jgi:hypothetical protein
VREEMLQAVRDDFDLAVQRELAEAMQHGLN